MKKTILAASLSLSLALSGSALAADAPAADATKPKALESFENDSFQKGEMRLYLGGPETELRPQVDTGKSGEYPYIYRDDFGNFKTGSVPGGFIDGDFFLTNNSLKDFPLFKGGVFYKKTKTVNDYDVTTIVYFNDDVQLNLGSQLHTTDLIKNATPEKYFSLGYGGDESRGMAVKWGSFPLRNGLKAGGIDLAYSKSTNTIYMGQVPAAIKAEEEAWKAKGPELVLYKGKVGPELQQIKWEYNGKTGTFPGYQADWNDIQIDSDSGYLNDYDLPFVKNQEMTQGYATIITIKGSDHEYKTIGKNAHFSFKSLQQFHDYKVKDDRIIIKLDAE